MKIAVELCEIEGRESHTIQQIAGLIDTQYQAIKKSNPNGYLDEFESRIELIAMDIATNLGAKFDYVQQNDKLTLLFDWTNTGGSVLADRREALLVS